MQIIAIVSPGTNAGKTLVTTSYAYNLRKKGASVRVIKPIISGFEESNNDTIEIIKSLGLLVTEENIARVSPWRFKAPLSPDIAALKENKVINLTEIVEFCGNDKQNKAIEYLIIEIAGGILTPINDKETMLDIVSTLNADIILVTNHYLGSISHTLMAYNLIKLRNLALRKLIISQNEQNNLSVDDTVKTLKNFIKVPIVTIPFIDKHEEKWKCIKNLEEI
ncbi:ATP-dependent dethiobiotin synthetase BioD [Rickettsiales bacterium Ac37b]|nr:ATP-dependent dethiobiotin synthetase BioD [Rickettsiales bacterium Ac37b]